LEKGAAMPSSFKKELRFQFKIYKIFSPAKKRRKINPSSAISKMAER